MLSPARRAAVCAALAVMTCLSAIGDQRSASVTATSDAFGGGLPPSLPWWKGSLAHTVQEEWLFAQHMDAQHGPRWRTALPDKAVARMYRNWLQGRQGGGNR